MDEHTITCNTETERNQEQVNNIKPIVPIKTPNKNKEHPQQSHQYCYGEKFLWLGVPQQTDLTPEINLSQYAIEIKCLTLKDRTSYLISDG